MAYVQSNSPFLKQKGGGTTKTCLPASKLRSLSKKQREEKISAFNYHVNKKKSKMSRILSLNIS